MSTTKHQDSPESIDPNSENSGNDMKMPFAIDSKEDLTMTNSNKSLNRKNDVTLSLSGQRKVHLEQPLEESQCTKQEKCEPLRRQIDSFNFNETEGRALEVPKLQSISSIGSMISPFRKITTAKTYHFTVGKIHNGVALLINDDISMVEFPLSLLPADIRKGNILKFSVERNLPDEEFRKELICNIQREILTQNRFFDEYTEQKPIKIEENKKFSKIKELSTSTAHTPNKNDVLVDIKNGEFTQKAVSVVLDVKSESK